MSRPRPCPVPGELHRSASHAIAAAGSASADGKRSDSPCNPQSPWVPWILGRGLVPLTSPHLSLTLAPSWLRLTLPVSWYLSTCDPTLGTLVSPCTAVDTHGSSATGTPRGPLQVNPPRRSYPATWSVPAAYVNPALPLLLLRCPLVAVHPIAQPESQTHLALAGDQGLTSLDHKKMPHERERPSVE